MTRNESLFILKCLKELYFWTKRYRAHDKERIQRLQQIFDKLDVLNNYNPPTNGQVELAQNNENSD